jgi:hypothetical protein
VLVTCGSNSDCADIPEKSNCKQEKDGESTCQSPSKCSCLDDDYCTMEDTCRKPGIQIYKSTKNEKRNISATCESNSDCEASPMRPVCKETVPGGTKICQSSGASSKECLPTQFTDAEDNCIGNFRSNEMEVDTGDG